MSLTSILVFSLIYTLVSPAVLTKIIVLAFLLIAILFVSGVYLAEKEEGFPRTKRLIAVIPWMGMLKTAAIIGAIALWIYLL